MRRGGWGGGRLAGELLDDRAGDGGGEQGVAAGDDAHRGGDLFGRGIFEHEAARAGA